jgi:DNA-binding NarL/FixJ family response regulator
MTTGRSARFIVADDHPLVRQGVRLVLETEFTGSLVVETADLDAALEAIVDQPDALLLIDLDMPGMDGVESLRALRNEFPQLLMAVLTGNNDRQVIADALSTGVNGYILKSSRPEDLLTAISTIRDGRIYRPNVPWKSLSEMPPEPPCSPTFDATSERQLTPRQRQVIQWLLKGHSNKQIARNLEIGLGTVKIHLAAIFRALGAKNRTEAVIIATQLKSHLPTHPYDASHNGELNSNHRFE